MIANGGRRAVDLVHLRVDFERLLDIGWFVADEAGEIWPVRFYDREKYIYDGAVWGLA